MSQLILRVVRTGLNLQEEIVYIVYPKSLGRGGGAVLDPNVRCVMRGA